MRLITSLLLAALLGACGFKGPLVLPKPAPQAQPEKPAPSPQPAQNPDTQDPSSQ
jgi:predicted small lipoprotein YifL